MSRSGQHGTIYFDAVRLETDLLKKQYRVEMVLLNFPELPFKWCKRIPSLWRDIDRAVIVIRMTRSIFVFLQYP